MDFANERYVRFYVRETTTFRLMSFEGQALMPHVLRLVDRAGVLELGGVTPVEALSLALPRWPADVLEKGLAELVRRGVIQHNGDALVWPKYIEAQEHRQSDAQRQRDSRERRRSAAIGQTSTVTGPGALVNKISGKRGDAVEGIIYVVGTGTHVKIGFTQGFLNERVRQIETATGKELEIVGWFRGTRGEERAAHTRFDHLRLAGEWFSQVPEITQWIQKIVTMSQADGQTVTPSVPAEPAEPEEPDIRERFARLISKYPKRAGGNPPGPAFESWRARLREGVSAEVLESAVERYAAFCAATGKIGTEFVMQASSFFGPKKRGWEQDWTLPAEPPRGNGITLGKYTPC